MRIYKPSIITKFKKLHSFNKGRFVTAIVMALYCYAFSILMAYLFTTVTDIPYGVIAFGLISFMAGLYCEWQAFKILEDR